MPTITEGQLRFDLPTAIAATRFDGADHGLSHCMKAVDFIVELQDRYLFVEVKDPFAVLTDPTAASHAEKARAKFRLKLSSDELALELTGKYRDTFLYRWAEGKHDKDVYYIVLLELPTLDDALLLTFTHRLKQLLPLAGTPTSWVKQLLRGVAVLNMEGWNALSAYGTVTRVP